MPDYKKKTFVAGRGLVGSAILRKLESLGAERLISPTSRELDLTNQAAVESFFQAERPAYVFLAAAKVGSIVAHVNYPADFLRINLTIQTNVIDAAYRHGCEKLLFVGSSCIYPCLCPQPIKEEYFLTGPLESANEAYAVAKIAGLMMCRGYRRQFGFDAISVMPTNLYGPGDNFHPQNSHLIPGLIRRLHEAKMTGQSQAVVWGTGTPLKDILHVDDLASACVFLMNNYSGENHVNIGSGQEISILKLAGLVAKAIGFQGHLTTDPSRPDGAPRKLLDISCITQLGWKPGISLEAGLADLYTWYLQSEAGGRLRS